MSDDEMEAMMHKAMDVFERVRHATLARFSTEQQEKVVLPDGPKPAEFEFGPIFGQKKDLSRWYRGSRWRTIESLRKCTVLTFGSFARSDTALNCGSIARPSSEGEADSGSDSIARELHGSNGRTREQHKGPDKGLFSFTDRKIRYS